jgi:hypothetical protein
MGDVAIFTGAKERFIQFDKDTEVLIRHIDAARLRKLRGKGQKMAIMGGGIEAEHTNRLIGEEAVRGWRKVGDPNHPGFMLSGQPVPFSDANRNMFMDQWLKFSNFANENCTDSESFAEEEKERAEGLESVKNA